MALVKPTEEGEDRLLAKLSGLKARKDRILQIGQLRDQPGWEAYKATLKEMADTHDKSVKAFAENGRHLSPEERCNGMNSSIDWRDSLRWAIKVGEQPEDEIKTLKTAIADLERDLTSKRDEIEAFGLK